MSIENILTQFNNIDFIYPRLIGSSRSFNREGTSLYYYIHGTDSEGMVAGLRLDFFGDKIRFTNFKKPHPIEQYRPQFNRFKDGSSCSDEDVLERFESSSLSTKIQLEKMAKNWNVSVERFINTVLVAYELLWDAEENGWLGISDWDGGEFKGQLPQSS